MKNTIVSAEWLKEHINKENLVVLDASPSGNVSGLVSLYEGQQIAGARPLDLKNDFSKKDAPFPNTLPETKQFEKKAQKLGVCNNSWVVVYDNLGIYSSPRVWWMFKTMGLENCFVLNGGLTAWVEAGGAIEQIQHYSGPHGDFTANRNDEGWRNIEDVENNIKTQQECVIDARSEGRFRGTAPEPREALSSGHIPGSKNLPFEAVLENGKLKSTAELGTLFKEIVQEKQPLVFSCGSGLTACINLLAASQVLDNPLSVYDGSWTEWAQLRPEMIDRR